MGGILHDNWSPAFNISKIFISLKYLLKNPEYDNGCGNNNMEACILYKEDRQKFEKIAREWIKKYVC